MINSVTGGRSNRYFAAANSGRGFRSYFNELFFNEAIKRRYIIKGGPGTGKSSLMKRIGALCEREGRTVEYYYCSSDTDSLDGIVIDSSVAMLDGTAPHSFDTALPGALDEIINLGAFWDADGLSAHTDAIRDISRKKRSAYERAYQYLSAALETSLAIGSLASDIINYAKLHAAVVRKCEQMTCSGRGALIPSTVSAIGAKGRVRFNTLEERASRIYVIEDLYGAGRLYTLALTSELLARGCELRVAYGTVDTETIEAVLIQSSGECFVIGRADDFGDYPDVSVINCKRFVYPERIPRIRKEYRAGERAYKLLVELAERELFAAGAAHAELESIYTAHMDFGALDAFFAEISKKFTVD